MPWGEIADEFLGNVEGVQFAIDLLLAHAAGDELGDLGAEIENEDFLVHFRGGLWGKGENRKGAGTRPLPSSPFPLPDGSFDVVVRRFLGDLHVVDMGFADAGRGDLDETGFGVHAVDGGAAEITMEERKPPINWWITARTGPL